jgi:hypothetical protein
MLLDAGMSSSGLFEMNDNQPEAMPQPSLGRPASSMAAIAVGGMLPAQQLGSKGAS